MKKLLLLLFLLMTASFIKAQGLKDIELGDYGLTSPLWGRDKIETTLLGCKGSLKVKKYNSKIYSIKFNFSNNRDFTQEMADDLAKSLINKYPNIKIEQLSNGNWVPKDNLDETKLWVFIEPGFSNNSPDPFFRGESLAVVELEDYVVSRKIRGEEKKKVKGDF